MFLLTELTKTGYLQIKNDREILLNKIQQYQSMVDEFDLALPFLEAIYEPKVKCFKRMDSYEGIAFVPFNSEQIKIRVRIKDDYYSGNEDPKLLDVAETLIKEKIKEQFPNHFKND